METQVAATQFLVGVTIGGANLAYVGMNGGLAPWQDSQIYSDLTMATTAALFAYKTYAFLEAKVCVMDMSDNPLLDVAGLYNFFKDEEEDEEEEEEED